MSRFGPIRSTPRGGAHGATSVVTVLLTLMLAFGYGPAIEVHAHADGNVAHVHDHADLAPSDFGLELSQPYDEDAAPVQHVHETAPQSYTVPDVLAHDPGDLQLTSRQLPVVAGGRGIEPPAPPNRPPIPIHG